MSLRLSAHRQSPSWVRQETRHRGREGLGPARLDEQAGLAGNHDVGHPALETGDDGRARRLGLEQRHPISLAAGRPHQKIGGRVDLRQRFGRQRAE